MSGTLASSIRQYRDSPNSKVPPTPSSAMNIKLIRSSAARPLLYSKANKEMMQRLADVIQDSNTSHKGSTKGLLPVEAAYSVMKRVTQAAGEPLLPTGMSTFNKLQSLRTEPALKVLKSQTWKTFFSEGGSANHGSSRSSSPQPSLRSGSFLRPLSAQSQASHHSMTDSHHSNSHTHQHGQQQQSARGHSAGGSQSKHGRHLSPDVQQSVLQGVADGLIERIVGLWHQLKIPAAEQDFHRRQLLTSSHHNKKGDQESLAHCRELATLLEGLLQHKELTKVVLREVKHREVVLTRCLDVLRALHRKQHLLHQHNHSNNDHHQREGLFWKEELLLALSELRLVSIKVIRAIATWRKQLWRPQPFHCHGVNYLLKMASDMAVLQSEGMRKLLSLLSLTLMDLQGILFLSAEEMNAAIGSMMHSQSAPAMLQADQQHDHSNPLTAKIKAFCDEIPAAELKAVVAFVLDEPRLQNALLMERSALQSKGVFIPLLRLPVISGNSKGSQQQPQRQSPEPKMVESPILQLNRPPSMKAFKEKKLEQQRREQQQQEQDEDEEENHEQTVESKGDGEAYGEDFDDQNGEM